MRHFFCLSLLALPLFVPVTVFADDPPAENTLPPTPEEVQQALANLKSYFTGPVATAKQPEWFPMKADDARRLDELLTAWAKGRAKGAPFRCQFRRWEYDPAFGPKDPDAP